MIEKGKDPKLESYSEQWGDQRFVSKPVTLYLGLLSLILGPTYYLRCPAKEQCSPVTTEAEFVGPWSRYT